jgi:hypothetical protein
MSNLPRVVCTTEPIEPPVAPTPDGSRKNITLGPTRNTTISCTPSVGGRVVLAGAAVEDTDTTPWNINVKVVLAEITTGIGGLDNHLLASNRAGSEGEFVASAAPLALARAFNVDCSIPNIN